MNVAVLRVVGARRANSRRRAGVARQIDAGVVPLARAIPAVHPAVERPVRPDMQVAEVRVVREVRAGRNPRHLRFKLRRQLPCIVGLTAPPVPDGDIDEARTRRHIGDVRVPASRHARRWVWRSRWSVREAGVNQVQIVRVPNDERADPVIIVWRPYHAASRVRCRRAGIDDLRISECRELRAYPILRRRQRLGLKVERPFAASRAIRRVIANRHNPVNLDLGIAREARRQPHGRIDIDRVRAPAVLEYRRQPEPPCPGVRQFKRTPRRPGEQAVMQVRHCREHRTRSAIAQVVAVDLPDAGDP